MKALAWSPSFSNPSSHSRRLARHLVGLFAIVNDNAEISILKLSRSVTMSNETSFQVHFVTSCSIDKPSFLEISSSPDNIQWSGWEPSPDSLPQSSLIYSSGEFVHTVQLKWVEANDIAPEDLVFVFDISEHGIIVKDPGNWPMHDGQIAVSANDLLWQEVESLRHTFSERYGLMNQVFARFWGLCTYKNVVATHLTLHPSTMVLHVIPSREASFVVFSPSNWDKSSQSAENLGFDWEHAPLPKTHKEAHIEPWHFVLSQLPRLSAASLPAIDTQIMTPASDGEFSGEYKCKKIVYIYMCLALFYGWASEGDILSFIQWVTGGNSGSIDAVSSAVKALKIISDDDERVVCLGRMHETLVQVGVNACLELCEICDARILWNGVSTAQCSEGHIFGRWYFYFLSAWANL